MSESLIDTGNLLTNLLLIGSGIGGGSIAVAALEWFLNKKTKEREEYIQTAHEKIKTTSNTLSILMNLVGHANSFASQIENKNNSNDPLNLKKESIDIERCLFHLSAFLFFFNILNNRGGLQLGNFDAEKIIYSFINNSLEIFSKYFNYESRHFLAKLVADRYKNETDIDYVDFLERINGYNYIKRVLFFKEWISTMDSETRKTLLKNFKWFSELLNLEVNYIFTLYYGKEPDFQELDPELKEHLAKNKDYTNYYKRLKNFNKRLKIFPRRSKD